MGCEDLVEGRDPPHRLDAIFFIERSEVDSAWDSLQKFSMEEMKALAVMLSKLQAKPGAQ
jgi:hypothetical protein